MHQEMQLVDSLVYMPMSEIPGFVVKHLLNGIHPVFSAVIYCGLVYSWQEALCRNILIWAVVRKHHIHGVCSALLLDILLNCRSRLLVRPPIVSHTETVELIHAVSAANHNALLALYIENIAVNREQDIGEILFEQHTTNTPLLFRLGIKMIFLFFLWSNAHSIQSP